MNRQMQLALGFLLLLAAPAPHFAESYESEAGDFFPLEVGNRWVFQLYDVRYSETFRLEETISMEVTGQVQLKEHSYFVVQKPWNVFLPEDRTIYLRKEGSQVFCYIEQPDTLADGILTPGRDTPGLRPIDEENDWPIYVDPNQPDWLLYDFAAPQGSVWDLPLPEYWAPNPYAVIWWVRADPLWDAPIPPSQKFFTFVSTTYVDGGRWDEVFEVNVGPVYFRIFPQEIEALDFGRLKEAHIGGQTILRDQITSVEQTSWGQVKASLDARLMPAATGH